MTVLALMPNDAEEKIISLRIFMPESLRNSFKAVCAKQGKNMSEVVTEFVKDYVVEHESPSTKQEEGAA
ncbi:plasmid partition protein ParG [Scytonema sp. PCC 10023]|jgi:metal-responsive CopG/Arc/MetJ family transcriptional regulator|uniref:plasmid partition protein ParG n=1 Tax=Scytonema sp. PCC 10023 TaxID=1680591 RepID=UPI0039C5B258